jgi:hypothetical protein
MYSEDHILLWRCSLPSSFLAAAAAAAAVATRYQLYDGSEKVVYISNNICNPLHHNPPKFTKHMETNPHAEGVRSTATATAALQRQLTRRPHSAAYCRRLLSSDTRSTMQQEGPTRCSRAIRRTQTRTHVTHTCNTHWQRETLQSQPQALCTMQQSTCEELPASADATAGVGVCVCVCQHPLLLLLSTALTAGCCYCCCLCFYNSLYSHTAVPPCHFLHFLPRAGQGRAHSAGGGAARQSHSAAPCGTRSEANAPEGGQAACSSSP